VLIYMVGATAMSSPAIAYIGGGVMMRQ